MITPTLEFAFSVRLEFPPGPRLRFPLQAGGSRGFVSLLGGEVTGPRLEGEVVAGSGGDWPRVRADGGVVFGARYLLKAPDWALFPIFNTRFAHVPQPA